MGGVDATEELVRRARDGDAAAYDRLFDQVSERVLVYIRCRLGRSLAAHVDCLDVLQETYLHAHRSFTTFEPGRGDFMGWLCGVADHRLRDLADHHGAKKRRPPGGALVQASTALARVRAEQTGPATAAARRDRDERLVAALEGLEPDAREAVLLRHFRGYTLDAVALALGTSERTVRRLLAKATSRIGRELSADD